jgi:hypothetical protein
MIDGKEKTAKEIDCDEADEYLAYIDEDEQRLHEVEAEGQRKRKQEKGWEKSWHFSCFGLLAA